ncbi:hypothetical protein FQR65_LT15720 [Abscondita terminalis]|nr:hypothetical protein FQR65_LT15720 [Abscondita terminalis]
MKWMLLHVSWITKKNFCFYPNVKTDEARDKLLKTCAEPSENWKKCRIKVLRYFQTFSAAREKLRTSEYTLCLESKYEEEELRKRTRKIIVLPGEDSDDENGEQ